MKKILIVAVAGLMGVMSAVAAQMSLADARAQIDKAIENKELMTSIFKQLSAADQKQFLNEVNAAIGKLSGTKEELAALYLTANRVALTSAAPGNLKALTAEMFATVPHDALTAICETFSKDLFGRDSNPNLKVSDEEFTRISLDLMTVVNARTAETDNPSTRSALAILMLLKASNGTPEDLQEKLIETLKDDDAKDLAKNEWIPHALVKKDEDRKPDYDPILASADFGRRPDLDFVLVIVGPQHLDSVLADLIGKNTGPEALSSVRTPVVDAVQNPLRHQIPTLSGDIFDSGMIGPQPGGDIPVPEEPKPYEWQSTRY